MPGTVRFMVWPMTTMEHVLIGGSIHGNPPWGRPGGSPDSVGGESGRKRASHASALQTSNNPIIYDIPLYLESVGCGPVCPPCVIGRPNRADARVCPYGKY